MSLSNFLSKNILSVSSTLNAKASGALRIVNGIISGVDDVLSNLLGLVNKFTSASDLNLTYDEYNQVSTDQKIVATVVDPQQAPITSTENSPTFAIAAASSKVTKISQTQPNDIHVEPNGVEPPMAFRGQYPYVHTYKSESGHIREVDDTPGHERLLEYHRTGTYQEINENGRRVLKVVNDNYEIIVGEDKIYIEGSAHVEVKGLINITCRNDVSLNVGGRVEINANEDLRIKARSIAMESTTGDINIYSAKSLNTQSKANTSMYSQSNMNTLAAESMSTSAVKNIVMGSLKNISMRSLVSIDMDSSIVTTNKGQSLPVANSNTVIVTKKTGLGDAPDREFSAIPSIFESISQGIDDPEAGDTSASIDEAIKSGRLTKEEVEEYEKAAASQTEKQADTTAARRVEPIAKTASSIALLSETSISGELKLSDNFNLSQLTDGAGVYYKYKLSAQNGLTKAQLAANLSLFAINVLEPLNKKFGPIRINNGFRSINNSNDTGAGSQHCFGQAADITYGNRSRSPEQMFNIAQWIKNNIPFDQLILEYGKNQIWTHISFAGPDSNCKFKTLRRQILTCPNAGTRYPIYDHAGLKLLSWH